VTTLDLARGRPATAFTTALGALAVFGAAMLGGRIALAATAAAVVALLAYAADRAPRRAMVIGLGAVVVVPVYWGQPVVGLAIVAVPATAAAVVLSVPALRGISRVRWGLLDAAYLGYVAALALSAYLHTTSGTGAAAGIVWRYAIPYAVWRSLAPRAPRWVTLARTLVATGTAMAVFALVEKATGGNWYFTAVAPGYQKELAVSLERFGSVRAEASFGEPISFGLFLAVCLVLAVTLAVASGRRAERAASVVAVGLLASAILASGSRAALGVAVIGLLVQAGRFVNRAYARRALVILALAVTALVTTGYASQVKLVLATVSGTSTREARSAQYRVEVIDVLTHAQYYSVVGGSGGTEGAQGVGALAVQRSGLKSLDDQYAFLLVTGGVLALGAFVTVGGVVFREALTGEDRDIFERAATSGLAALFAGFLVVALLTQLSDVFAILVALLAGARQTRRLLT
jgi:hypothetical protein